MRRLLVPSFLVLFVGGCCLTAKESEAIAKAAAEAAGNAAFDKAKKAGMSDEEAEKVRVLVRDEAEKLANKALPEGEDKKKSKTGAALLSVLMVGLQLLGGRRVG